MEEECSRSYMLLEKTQLLIVLWVKLVQDVLDIKAILDGVKTSLVSCRWDTRVDVRWIVEYTNSIETVF